MKILVTIIFIFFVLTVGNSQTNTCYDFLSEEEIQLNKLVVSTQKLKSEVEFHDVLYIEPLDSVFLYGIYLQQGDTLTEFITKDDTIQGTLPKYVYYLRIISSLNPEKFIEQKISDVHKYELFKLEFKQEVLKIFLFNEEGENTFLISEFPKVELLELIEK